MVDDKYIVRLENVIKQMLVPLKGIPFNLAIEAITGKKVLSFDYKNTEHKKVLQLLTKAAIDVGNSINKIGIVRQRPNEVGNDIEPFVKDALNKLGLNADVPNTSKGTKKSVGYPDIIFHYNNKPYYLECKTYNIENIETSQRSFYFSLSDEFKVIHDAIHLLISFEIYVAGEFGIKHIFKCKHYKILSLDTLSLDVKHEFNSDNKRLYSGTDGTKILAEGEIK